MGIFSELELSSLCCLVLDPEIEWDVVHFMNGKGH